MTTFFRRTAALILCTVLPVTAQVPGDFICAGTLLDQVAGKPTQSLPKDVRTTGRIKILVVFAKFAGDYPQETSAPEWASGLFDVNQPGSLSHFYDTMSGGQLAVEGTVAPGFYEASRPTAAYLAPTDTERGGYPAFSHEILPLVDADLNLGDFNNDGADGIANSADDDNLVDFTFIILKDVPARFLAGPATGIFGLGRYYRDFVSADSTGTRSLGAIASRFLRIPTERISVMQGASLPEAAGILSHEFAHLLGVPDLFNVDFVYREGRQPVDDSAGIGAWGLMGWGALGWSGNDGPNSFSAWTLLELGWVDIVRPTSKNDVMRLAPIMEGRAVYEILLPNNRERFLVANRSRADNYYDRHIPGEGLLIWHEETDAALNGADLECADGKWVSAGFPLGSIQDESDGGDNLDFWAHDAQYRQTHAGNIGDATDPFDGVNYRRFSPETNPGSRSSSGEWSFLVEDIEFDADRIATAIVHPVPLVEVTLKITDDSGDGLVLAGEGAALGFNLSVLERFSGDLRAVFVSSDSLVEIERPEFIFQTDFGGSSTIKTFDTARRTPLETLPRFRVPGSVEAVREVPIQMLIYRGTGSLGTLLWQEDFSVEVISAQRPHLSQVSFVEVAGNGDGKAQAGEIVSLSVDLELLKADILRALTVQVGVVDTEVRRLSPSVLTFGALSEGKAHSSHSPDFLLPLDLRTDTELQFAVSFSTGFENWSDTISVAVTAGVDETPPRVGDAFVSTTPQGLSMVLLQSRILDASQIASATGLVRGLPNNELLASIELTRYDDRFAGAWATDAAGPVAVTVVVGDRPGNEGLSPAEQVAMAQSRVGPFPIGVDEVGVGAPITGLAFNLSGSLVSVASGTSLKLYDPLTLRLLQTFPLASKATAVANDPWNELLAAGAADGTVALWDLNGMREVGRFGEGEPSAVRALAFGTNPRLLAIGYQDGRVDLWDIRRGLPSYSQTLRPHSRAASRRWLSSQERIDWRLARRTGRSCCGGLIAASSRFLRRTMVRFCTSFSVMAALEWHRGGATRRSNCGSSNPPDSLLRKSTRITMTPSRPSPSAAIARSWPRQG